jgi:hypothetical protein
MEQQTEARALSSDELDSVSGGKDIVVCVQTSSFKLFGLTFHFASCENGQKIAYVTQ